MCDIYGASDAILPFDIYKLSLRFFLCDLQHVGCFDLTQHSANAKKS